MCASITCTLYVDSYVNVENKLCNYICIWILLLCRVMQVLGFEKDDLVGQKIFDFFHPKEYYRTEHFVCWKKC